MAHFIALPKLPSAQELADLFIAHVFRLHGIPENVVSDRGVQFVSEFWRSFCKSLGISLSFSSGFHPQTNGQTERVNQELEQFLRCFASDAQEEWVKFLPFAEFCHNNLQNASTKHSPFQVVFGRSPKFSSLPCVQSSFPVLEEWGNKVRQVWGKVTQNIKKAVASHKKQADRHRTPEKEFAVGDRVWVSTRNIALRQPSAKLGPKFIGPYPILERINKVSYRVGLPAGMRSVKSFHVSLLKPALLTDTSPPPPPVIIDGEPEYEVERILDSRRWRSSLQYLVHWKGYGPEERSWVPARNVHAEELIREFHAAHPDRPALARSVTTPQGEGTVSNVTCSTSAASSTPSVGAMQGDAGMASTSQTVSGHARVGRRPLYAKRRRVS